LCEKLSAGSFGQVFRGVHLRTERQVAMKFELASTSPAVLKHECKILYYLRDRGCRNVPEVEWWSLWRLADSVVYRVLVMPLMDAALPTCASPLQICEWVREMIRILYQVHEAGIVHRDVKPQNFMLRNDVVYLLDFGLSSVFVDDDFRRHLPAKADAGHILGTPKYVSVHVHDGKDPSRRDDLISVGYVWLYLTLGGALPWDDAALTACGGGGELRDIMHPLNQERKRLKMSYAAHAADAEYLRVVQSLKYDERPNYSRLIELVSRRN
jgi:serine/threonine protein kinase